MIKEEELLYEKILKMKNGCDILHDGFKLIKEMLKNGSSRKKLEQKIYEVSEKYERSQDDQPREEANNT